jgi:hypothetical protein
MFPNIKSSYREYKDTFVQPTPSFALKGCGENKNWISINSPISNRLIERHLDQEICIATLGRWYPECGIVDIDNKPFDEVLIIRETLGFDENNSLLYNSETPGNYHILFKPEYRNKPPTLKLLNSILKNSVQKLGCEIHPQENKTIRLPFGLNQRGVDSGFELLPWNKSVYWFGKIDSFDLSIFNSKFVYQNQNYKQTSFNYSKVFTNGNELLKTGLIQTSSRNESQFNVLYYFFQLNYQQIIAEAQTLLWLQESHNGFSETINSNRWQIVKKEINRQATHIWDKYTFFVPKKVNQRFYGSIGYSGESCHRFRLNPATFRTS